MISLFNYWLKKSNIAQEIDIYIYRCQDRLVLSFILMFTVKILILILFLLSIILSRYHLQKKGIISENRIKFCFGEMLIQKYSFYIPLTFR